MIAVFRRFIVQRKEGLAAATFLGTGVAPLVQQFSFWLWWRPWCGEVVWR
jgi:hypothetical protein